MVNLTISKTNMRLENNNLATMSSSKNFSAKTKSSSSASTKKSSHENKIASDIIIGVAKFQITNRVEEYAFLL